MKRLENFIDENENFFSHMEMACLLLILKVFLNIIKKEKIITVTAVRPPARFGELRIVKDRVVSFKEKPQTNSGWINGGFFVARKKFFKFIRNDKDILEKKPLEKALKIGQLNAYKHRGFWKCMDTIRDKQVIEEVLKNKKL